MGGVGWEDVVKAGVVDWKATWAEDCMRLSWWLWKVRDGGGADRVD